MLVASVWGVIRSSKSLSVYTPEVSRIRVRIYFFSAINLGDIYHAKGVAEKDILIIATERANGAELV